MAPWPLHAYLDNDAARSHVREALSCSRELRIETYCRPATTGARATGATFARVAEGRAAGLTANEIRCRVGRISVRPLDRKSMA